MIFSSKARGSHEGQDGHRTWGGRLAALAGAAALGLIASCGGSTSQFDAFVPKRLLAFGDETSSLTPTGRNYSVNGIDTATGAFVCTAEPIWVQSVASLYGFTFPECTGANTFDPVGRILAQPGAKATDVAAQIEAQVAAGGFRETDLVTVLAGANDIQEIYAQYPGLSESILLDQARERGRILAKAVNRLVALGAKVIVSDLPDQGLSPFAQAQKAQFADTDRAALLTRLTTAFNEQLGVNVVLDGSKVGLVQAQLRFQAIQLAPSAFGIADLSTALCTVPLPDCSTATLIENGSPSSYLWADELHLSPGGHSQLATLAIDRARRNPF